MLWQVIDQFLQILSYWHWSGLGAVLLVLELVTGSGFLFWIALSALSTAILTWLIPSMTWPLQLLFFAIFSIVVAVGWWRYLKSNPSYTEDPTLNQRNLQFIGRTFILENPVINGMGSIRVDDSQWRFRCNQDLPAGSKILIVGVDGVFLIAEAEHH
ncbi:MAG: NfeD family protein [Legionellales bacterium]|nr:NfeD family protein [Legionellales bacterium]